MTSMLSIPAFVAEHGISKSLFYRLVKEGRGPRLTKVASRTLISAEAAAEWRDQMEQETEQGLPRQKVRQPHGLPTHRPGPGSDQEAA
jgi:predicted DNA-binding transcriptional regulator AlpA